MSKEDIGTVGMIIFTVVVIVGFIIAVWSYIQKCELDPKSCEAPKKTWSEMSNEERCTSTGGIYFEGGMFKSEGCTYPPKE